MNDCFHEKKSLWIIVESDLFSEVLPRPYSPTVPSEEDSVLFNKLTYLGCMKVSAPRSEPEALSAMAILKNSSHSAFPVILYVPNIPDGSVR